MSAPGRLTLGALYREMRSGLGDAGSARVVIEFRQRTMDVAEPAAPEPRAGDVTLVLQATLDHLDRVLVHAEISLSGPEATRDMVVTRSGDGYAYSVDQGHRWGSFTARPRIFDIEEFERELAQVAVEDVSFQPVGARRRAGEPQPVQGEENPLPLPGAGGADTLDVSLDRDAFSRLLRIFAADLDEAPEALALDAYSVSLEAAEDVSLLYWWSMSGHDRPLPALLEDAPTAHGLMVSCGVTVRVLPFAEPPGEAVVLEPNLPELSRIDEVWELLRRDVRPAP